MDVVQTMKVELYVTNNDATVESGCQAHALKVGIYLYYENDFNTISWEYVNKYHDQGLFP